MAGVNESPMTDAELDALEALLGASSPAPWESIVEGRDQLGGDSFIRLALSVDAPPGAYQPDMYVSHDGRPAGADQDFIAAARNALPRLLAEVKARRGRDSRP